MWFFLIFHCLKAGFVPCPADKSMVEIMSIVNVSYFHRMIWVNTLKINQKINQRINQKINQNILYLPFPNAVERDNR